MSNAQLKSVAGALVTQQEQDPKTFPGMLRAFKGEIERALPKHLNADRMTRIALTCFRQNPALGKCDPASVFAAVVQSAQLGLEPGLNGRAYLIPYGQECQFVPGWKGLVELANRTGRASCWTGAVFRGDDFDYALGDSPYVKHRPGLEDNPLLLEHSYAIGRVRGGEWPVVEVWTNAKIAKHRDRFNKVGKRHYSYENWEMYARKVPLLQVLKYLPSSPELETALALNDAAEMGASQGITIEGAMSNSYEPPSQPSGETVNTETGEITSGVRQPQLTFADVAAAIKGSETSDDLDAAADLVRSLADERQRAELELEVLAKRKALAQ